MKKKGDISLSFGMIFSIIVIAAIIGVAFYAINYFVNLGKCTEVSLFYRDFQERVDKAWNSEATRDEFSGGLPGGIKSVCFGDLASPGTGATSKEYEELKIYEIYNANTFLYPPEKTCDVPYKKINHIDLSELPGFTCFPVENGAVSIKLEKETYDSSVRIKK